MRKSTHLIKLERTREGRKVKWVVTLVTLSKVFNLSRFRKETKKESSVPSRSSSEIPETFLVYVVGRKDPLLCTLFNYFLSKQGLSPLTPYFECEWLSQHPSRPGRVVPPSNDTHLLLRMKGSSPVTLSFYGRGLPRVGMYEPREKGKVKKVTHRTSVGDTDCVVERDLINKHYGIRTGVNRPCLLFI